MTAALELRQIRKSFDGFPALNNADFTAMRGEVHALLGENGAGKSSLMNVAAGLYAADAGDMLVDGLGDGGLIKTQQLARAARLT